MVACVGICATFEVILIVLVLYFLVPPTEDYTYIITHVNPGEVIHNKRINIRLFCISPR